LRGARRRDVSAEALGLRIARRVVVMIVEPGFYPALLWDFFRARGSHLSRLMEGKPNLANAA